jgi:hypothetical protein
MKNDPDSQLALVPPEGASPLSLIERMIDQGKLTPESVGVVERLVHLQEHMLEKLAEQRFASAFAALQRETGKVKATKAVPNNDGSIRYFFAPFEEIMDRVQPLLNTHGFSVSFDMDFSEGRVTETCILTHESGHQRRNKFIVRIGSGPPKATETQADGAAATYAKRVALCNALNIVIEVDTDARNEGAPISPEQAQTLREMVKDTKSDEAAFLKYAGAKSYEEIGSERYAALFAALQKKGRQ